MLKNRVLASFGALFACGAAVAVYLENYIPLFLLRKLKTGSFVSILDTMLKVYLA